MQIKLYYSSFLKSIKNLENFNYLNLLKKRYYILYCGNSITAIIYIQNFYNNFKIKIKNKYFINNFKIFKLYIINNKYDMLRN